MARLVIINFSPQLAVAIKESTVDLTMDIEPSTANQVAVAVV